MTASHQGSASTPPTTSQTWSAWNRLTWPVMVLIVGSLLAAAVLLIISDSPWWFTVPVLAVIAFAATAPVWRMRVDNEGFHVSTWVGVPRQTVPHSDIEAVAPVTVNIWDWGGWGWRKSIQGTGLITQSGPDHSARREDCRGLLYRQRPGRCCGRSNHCPPWRPPPLIPWLPEHLPPHEMSERWDGSSFLGRKPIEWSHLSDTG